VQRLSSPRTVEEYAKVFYEALRQADILKLKEVVVYSPSGEGIAVAIRDRLGKASKGR
jgi:L-threonylcarbamoyladenylate synthase